MKKVNKIISLALAFVMVLSLFVGVDITTANAAEVRSATISNGTFKGLTGESGVKDYTLKISGDEFVALGWDKADATKWVKNLPSGMEVVFYGKINNYMGATEGDTELLFRVHGTSKTAVNASLNIVIPGSVLKSGKALEVTANANAKIVITKAPQMFLYGAASSTTVSLRWTKVSSATGYEIYGAKIGSKMKKIATIKKNTTVTYKLTKLKAKTNYTYYVKAIKVMEAGRQLEVRQSDQIYLVTSGGKYTNVGTVKPNFSKATIKVKKSTQIKPKATLQTKGKTALSVSKVAAYRYFTSNESIAKVSNTGKVTGVKAGKCTIYVCARSGKYAKIAITVK